MKSSSDFVQELCFHVNQLRTNPGKFLERFETEIELFVLKKPKNLKIGSRELNIAAGETLSTLKKVTPISQLIWSEGLSKVGQAYCNDLKLSIKERSLQERVKTFGKYNDSIQEAVDYGSMGAFEVVMSLLIDYNSKTKSNRNALLNPRFKKIGVGIAPHHEYYNVVSLVFAEDFVENEKIMVVDHHRPFTRLFANKSNRPMTHNNFRCPTAKDARHSGSVDPAYAKARSLKIINNEKASNSKSVWKYTISRALYSHQLSKIEPESSYSKICIQLSIFKERPGCILFDYPSYCTLESKLNSRCSYLTTEQSTRFDPRYKFTKKTPVYNCVVNSLEHASLKSTESKLKSNIILSALSKNKSLKYLNRYQKHNHFPGSWHLGRKDSLWRNIWKKKREFCEDYNICPNTFVLPDDFRLFQQDREDNPSKLWIYKPVASSCGRGIKIISSTSIIDKKSGYLISNYISDPHTINGLKYDLRIYVLVTSFDPLRIYIYKEGLVRFATQNYSKDLKSLKTRYIHLTNYSVNKKAPNYKLSSDTLNSDTLKYKWPLSGLEEVYKSMGIVYSDVFNRIKDVVIKTLIAVEVEIVSKTVSLTKHKDNCYELYGFDILLDSSLKPWLLEVNVAPSLSSGSILDKQIKTALMCDIFTLVGVLPYDRTILKKEEKKNLHEFTHKLKFKNYSNVMNEQKFGDLNENEVKVIADGQDEMQRLGRFERIFPLKENIDVYEKFFDVKRINNAITWVSIKSEVDVLSGYLTRI